MNINNESGWLFDNPQKNANHYITNDEIEQLLQLAQNEDAWVENTRIQLQKMLNKPRGVQNFFYEDLLIRNVAGTIVPYPFGLRIITFPSRRHLFRGENQVFEKSLPSLNRRLQGKSKIDKVMIKALADLRIYQFSKFIWTTNVVPFWEAKISDVNIKAIAQHYGFDTHLLDLTNDLKVALFFATCKYVPEKDCYRPLTEDEVKAHPYGVIFHTPDWQIDYINSGVKLIEWFMKKNINMRNHLLGLDNGELDGFAFQIGYQPFMRCHYQSGYILPMAIDAPLQDDWHFEKVYITQSVELSERVFDMMDGGKKVFPNEGITEANNVLNKIKNSYIFSEDDVNYVYKNDGVDKDIYPTLDDFVLALKSFNYDGNKVSIQKDEVKYHISQEILDKINAKYDENDLLEPVNGVIFQNGYDRKYREECCKRIYGKLI